MQHHRERHGDHREGVDPIRIVYRRLEYEESVHDRREAFGAEPCGGDLFAIILVGSGVFLASGFVPHGRLRMAS